MPVAVHHLQPQQPYYGSSSSSSSTSSTTSSTTSRYARLFFHTTPPRRDHDPDKNKNHYEILQVPSSAPPGDIKKSFYALSKAHHPDVNRDDPAASKRFMRISEAYGVLSDTTRRARYDRDVLRLHERPAQQHANHPHHPHHHRHGSYSSTSTGPAGGRPASGLSRRRSTFKGPPPSFYRNGGWGAYGAKRSQAHEETARPGEAGRQRDHHQQQQSGQQQWGSTGFGGGMGPGADSPAAGDVPHFDRAARAAHTRTQARVDEIRRRKAARNAQSPGGGDWGEFGSFFAVLGVLGIAIGVPYFVRKRWDTSPGMKGKKKSRSSSLAG
ncbi:hypothetical protein SLS53_002260 [Cytospora paraplurivora]|uniref:J domain-containing protein n=1 Tax=Cytospora paraplurivora TaxID=2898453 RepID=A0AAN9YJC5_9PEZI